MKRAIPVLAVILLLFSCSAKKSNQKPVIYVSILPQKHFVERIAGEHFDVRVMVKPGQSPASYEPLPSQMAELSNTRIYFSIGVPFEKIWMDKIGETNPKMKIIDTSNGITLRKMDVFEEHHDEHAKEDHGHEHGSPDPHIWLSPSLVKQQCETITQGLVAIDAEHAEEYRNNFVSFSDKLDSLTEEIHTSLSTMKEHEFLVFHPAFGYFGDEFGLKQVPIEIEGKEPGPKRLKMMIDMAKEKNIKIIFVQRQFSSRSAEAIAEAIGGQVVKIDPLEEDYTKNLKDIAKALKAIDD